MLFDIDSTFAFQFDIILNPDYLCEEVLGLVQFGGLVRVLNESDAEIGYSRVVANHDDVEVVLLQGWAYLALLTIAVVGFFAVLAILRKVVSPSSDDRPRDHKIKLAAASKITNVIENAVDLHKLGSNGKGRVMVSQ